jgi:hypothetical protein
MKLSCRELPLLGASLESNLDFARLASCAGIEQRADTDGYVDLGEGTGCSSCLLRC